MISLQLTYIFNNCIDNEFRSFAIEIMDSVLVDIRESLLYGKVNAFFRDLKCAWFPKEIACRILYKISPLPSKWSCLSDQQEYIREKYALPQKFVTKFLVLTFIQHGGCHVRAFFGRLKCDMTQTWLLLSVLNSSPTDILLVLRILLILWKPLIIELPLNNEGHL